ncbi:hypothetical protein C5S35_03475 [Candidatus Methanophagaceae archaeon]|nr:hypothetical protein C5S35_03475 [Methanophagales archaeon]
MRATSGWSMNKKDIAKQQSDFIFDTGNDVKVKNKKLQIRNSTVEILIFTKQNNKNTIGVRIEDETVWLTQKLMSVLFEKGRSTITGHLQNIFETGELKKSSVCRDFRHTAEDGKEYQTKLYSPDTLHINENFTHLRGTLLPKLISGEVRVQLAQGEAGI